MNRFSSPWKYFRLNINLKKTQVTGQDVTSPPSIKIFDQQIEVVHDSTSICSTWSEILWLRDIELNKRIKKVATTVFTHSKRATNWPNTLRSWYIKLACRAPSRVVAIPWLFEQGSFLHEHARPLTCQRARDQWQRLCCIVIGTKLFTLKPCLRLKW